MEADSDVQDPGPASTSHSEPLIHEPLCSAESAEEIVELPQLPHATVESEQLSADPVLHVRFQEYIFSEVCGASIKKSLAGLDSTQTDGVQALATLEDITHQLKQAASESPCADHCRVFRAFSRTETEYKGQCQHQHTITCDRCEDLKNAVSDLQLAVDSSEVHLSPDKREELQHDLVLLIMDWAMKFTPTSFRKMQRDWFRKKHLLVAITKAEDGTIETRTFIHLFDECTQNWKTHRQQLT